jgi:hypothetical protein
VSRPPRGTHSCWATSASLLWLTGMKTRCTDDERSDHGADAATTRIMRGKDASVNQQWRKATIATGPQNGLYEMDTSHQGPRVSHHQDEGQRGTGQSVNWRTATIAMAPQTRLCSEP